MTTSPFRIAITGAAGQLGQNLLFRLAGGALFGLDRPVELRLVEITPALKELESVVMELQDCAYSTLFDVEIGDEPTAMFDGAELVLMLGGQPRLPGMERVDFLAANTTLMTGQADALLSADESVRICVAANPANTNASTAIDRARDIDPRRFSALTRLDHNRARARVAARASVPIMDVRRIAVWGNHSSTVFPDLAHATIAGTPAVEVLDQDWMRGEFIDEVAQRGATIIDTRGTSAAASGASAMLDHVRDLYQGTAEGDWVSMAVVSDGSYGVPEGLVSSFPVTAAGGDWNIVPDLDISDFARARIDASVAELIDERDALGAFDLV